MAGGRVSGKGSAPRPLSVSAAQYAAQYERTFGGRQNTSSDLGRGEAVQTELGAPDVPHFRSREEWEASLPSTPVLHFPPQLRIVRDDE